MKNSKKYYIPKHWNSLDAPVLIWSKVHDTGDLSWLLISRKKISKKLSEHLLKVWENLYNQYLKEFGYAENFLAIKRKELQIVRMKMQMIISQDRSELTFIEIEEEMLSDMRKGITKADFMESKMAIESRMKFQINMKETSIREFYSYLKHLK